MDLSPFQCTQYLGGLKLFYLENRVKDGTHIGRLKTSINKANITANITVLKAVLEQDTWTQLFKALLA